MVVDAKVFLCFGVSIVAKPRRMVLEILCNKSFPLFVDFGHCKVFVDGFVKFLEIFTEVNELFIAYFQSEMFKLVAEYLCEER